MEQHFESSNVLWLLVAKLQPFLLHFLLEQKESPVEHEHVLDCCAEVCLLCFWGFAETITEHIPFHYRHSTCTTEHFSYSNIVLPLPWFQCPSCPAMLNQFLTYYFGGTLLHILLFWGYGVDHRWINECEAWWKLMKTKLLKRNLSHCHLLHHIYKSTEICFISICYSDVSCISSKESTATSEHVLCWCLQFEHWRKLKQRETMLLNPARCLLSAPSQTRWHVTLMSLNLTHLIQRAPMPHVVQRSWKWQACKVTWIA